MVSLSFAQTSQVVVLLKSILSGLVVSDKVSKSLLGGGPNAFSRSLFRYSVSSNRKDCVNIEDGSDRKTRALATERSLIYTTA